MENKTITLELTPLEAHTVLRALAAANVSEQTPATDIEPNTWVAMRLQVLIHQFLKES